MFKKLTTFSKISLVIAVVWLIVFCFQTDKNWYNILLGFLLYDSVSKIGTFTILCLNTVIAKIEKLTAQIEAKNNQK